MANFVLTRVNESLDRISIHHAVDIQHHDLAEAFRCVLHGRLHVGLNVTQPAGIATRLHDMLTQCIIQSVPYLLGDLLLCVHVERVCVEKSNLFSLPLGPFHLLSLKNFSEFICRKIQEVEALEEKNVTSYFIISLT